MFNERVYGKVPEDVVEDIGDMVGLEGKTKFEIEMLEGKLIDYQERVKDNGIWNNEGKLSDGFLKRFILGRLLIEGSVFGSEITQALDGEYGNENYMSGDFDNAWGVIRNYVLDGGKNNEGGTGLDPTIVRRK